MPGRGRGGRRRRRVMSFVQPCLLVMLNRDSAHGYSLLNGLSEFGFRPGQLDPSLVYRALREMEEIGLVSSEWDEESPFKPPRFSYCFVNPKPFPSFASPSSPFDMAFA